MKFLDMPYQNLQKTYGQKTPYRHSDLQQNPRR
jgi:hypothetical protein